MDKLEKYQLRSVRSINKFSFIFHNILIVVVFIGIFIHYHEKSNSTFYNLFLIGMSFIVALFVMKLVIYIEDTIREIPRKKFLKKILPVSLPVPDEYITFFRNDIEYILNQAKLFEKIEKKSTRKQLLYKVGIEGLEFVYKRLETDKLTKEDINFINDYFSKEIKRL